MTALIDETHDPLLTSWVESANGHPEFPIQNLPLGIFSTRSSEPRGGVAIGDAIVDLKGAAEAGLFQGLAAEAAAAASGPTLNPLLAQRADARRALRRALSTLLSAPKAQSRVAPFLVSATDCVPHLPAVIGDYTDFYAGIHHAENVGRLFRPDNPLPPNYKFVPIGYHGRASSIRPSGTAVRRPRGQIKAQDAAFPTFAPTGRLDFELEMGVWLCGENALGQPETIGRAADRIAGLCLLNDWSARDVQVWESQPLGPFLAKNFHSTISPWIVTAEALAPFRVAQPARRDGDPPPLPHLFDAEDQSAGAYAIDLEVFLSTQAMRERGLPPHRLSRSSMTAMYWTAAQLVTHHASSGCDLRPGDLLGTGTLSGPSPDSLGCLLEMTRGGGAPIELPHGEQRRFLEDGDEVIFAGRARRDGYMPIGFGACRAEVIAAI